ncbi:MAG: ATP-grasp domain-containing protein [Ruminococcaceae bacterium]|nr:ATP-grasp domain-containing protein [Oscillospiraceae bacterium]
MKKILVIGAGDYQVPAIKRISELGYEAFCVDKNDKAPGFPFAKGFGIIDVCDKEACLRFAKEIDVDGVMTYGATITLPTVVYIAKNLGLFSLPAETAEISKSKYQIKKCLSEHGANIKGRFFEICTPDDARLKSVQFPCIIKPSDGSGSKGVVCVTKSEELDAAVETAFAAARNNEVYVESYIDGEEYSVEAFANGNDIYIYAIVKTDFRRVNGEVIYGHCLWLGISSDVETLICEEVKKAMNALGITMGPANFDIIVSKDDGKPYIIDVGIRNGQNLIASHIVPYSRGISELDNLIFACLGEPMSVVPMFKKNIATKLLIYHPGVIREILPYEHLIGTSHIVDIVMRKKVGDILPPYKTKSDTCGWVITEGETPELAYQYANEAREILKKYIIIESN